MMKSVGVIKSPLRVFDAKYLAGSGAGAVFARRLSIGMVLI